MTIEEAKDKVRQGIAERTYFKGEYEIFEEGIIETDYAWYIPFRNNPPLKMGQKLIGINHGFIIGKVLGDLHHPGRNEIEEWLTGYELGLLGGPYDLKIIRINDWKAARHSIKRLGLTYYIPEIENGITRKDPQNFTGEMIEARLAVLPCTFRNQRFTSRIHTFKNVKASKIFEYELIKNTDAQPNEIGERIESLKGL